MIICGSMINKDLTRLNKSSLKNCTFDVYKSDISHVRVYFILIFTNISLRDFAELIINLCYHIDRSINTRTHARTYFFLTISIFHENRI